MKRLAWQCMIFALCLSSGLAQQTSTSNSVSVPHLVRFAGLIKDMAGQPLTGTVGVTLALYRDQEGGAPLWLEIQNVTVDNGGRYTVSLGATKTDGLPLELFTSGEARWLGVQPDGQAEQPRVLLLSVPYALKAADAETVGGLPPSAFMLAGPLPSASNSAPTVAATNPGSTNSSAPPASNVTGSGTINFLPLWTGTSTIGNSVLFQSGTGTAVKVGIGTTTPIATLDVKGAANVRGLLISPATGIATSAAGKPSQAQDFVASSFSSSTNAAVNQTFQWKAEAANNNTTTPSGTLNLLFGSGATAPTETGLKLSNNGLFTFATGQTFPGTGSGTVTSVGFSAPSTDFTVSGSPVTNAGTLNIRWTVVPASANTANAIVKRDASGNFSATSITATSLNAVNAALSGNLSISSAGGTPLAVASSAGNVITIQGVASDTTGADWGVEGLSASNASNAYGVYGASTSVSGTPKGVYGTAASITGVGVFGQNGTSSQTLVGNSVAGAGIWGDGGQNGAFLTTNIPGVVGTTNDSVAGWFENNGPDYIALEAASDNINAFPFEADNLANGSFCSVDNLGNLNCSGTKNAVVPIAGGKRKVALSAIESPKNWFEDFGSAQLTSGSAVVAIDPEFAQTVNTSEHYMVIPIPNGECKGLYITGKTATSFEVRESGGGNSSIAFDYRIVALRKNYENIRFADHTNDPHPAQTMQRMRDAGRTVKPETQAATTKKLALVNPEVGQGVGR
jgi:hypothetical protein